jgi:hypothetical protein
MTNTADARSVIHNQAIVTYYTMPLSTSGADSKQFLLQ